MLDIMNDLNQMKMRPQTPREGVREIQIVVNERQSDKVKETIPDVDGTQTKYYKEEVNVRLLLWDRIP